MMTFLMNRVIHVQPPLAMCIHHLSALEQNVNHVYMTLRGMHTYMPSPTFVGSCYMLLFVTNLSIVNLSMYM